MTLVVNINFKLRNSVVIMIHINYVNKTGQQSLKIAEFLFAYNLRGGMGILEYWPCLPCVL